MRREEQKRVEDPEGREKGSRTEGERGGAGKQVGEGGSKNGGEQNEGVSECSAERASAEREYKCGRVCVERAQIGLASEGKRAGEYE